MRKCNMTNICIIGIMIIILIVVLLLNLSIEKYVNNVDMNINVKNEIMRLLNISSSNSNSNQYNNFNIISNIPDVNNEGDYIVSGSLNRRLTANVNQLNNADLIARMEMRLSDAANPAVVNLNDGHTYRVVDFEVVSNREGGSRRRRRERAGLTGNTGDGGNVGDAGNNGGIPDPFTDTHSAERLSFENPLHEKLQEVISNVNRGGAKNQVDNRFPGFSVNSDGQIRLIS